MWPLLQLDPVAQGLLCGPTLWLKRLPSGPHRPEPEGGWLILQKSFSHHRDRYLPYRRPSAASMSLAAPGPFLWALCLPSRLLAVRAFVAGISEADQPRHETAV